MSKLGRPKKIGDEHRGFLMELAQAKPLATLAELVVDFRERTEITVHSATLTHALEDAAQGVPTLGQRLQEVPEAWV